MFFLIFLCLFLSSYASADAGLVINEFLPDPEGADSGQEFVEFMNNGSQAINLNGIEFQFANGSVGLPWMTRWQAQEDFFLNPGQLFLLVDRNWVGSALSDAEAWLGLQNGPDAIRVVRDEEVLDLVGYGSLSDDELQEISAVGLQPGLSLSRRPTQPRGCRGSTRRSRAVSRTRSSPGR